MDLTNNSDHSNDYSYSESEEISDITLLFEKFGLGLEIPKNPQSQDDGYAHDDLKRQAALGTQFDSPSPPSYPSSSALSLLPRSPPTLVNLPTELLLDIISFLDEGPQSTFLNLLSLKLVGNHRLSACVSTSPKIPLHYRREFILHLATSPTVSSKDAHEAVRKFSFPRLLPDLPYPYTRYPSSSSSQLLYHSLLKSLQYRNRIKAYLFCNSCQSYQPRALFKKGMIRKSYSDRLCKACCDGCTSSATRKQQKRQQLRQLQQQLEQRDQRDELSFAGLLTLGALDNDIHLQNNSWIDIFPFRACVYCVKLKPRDSFGVLMLKKSTRRRACKKCCESDKKWVSCRKRLYS